MTQCQGSRVRRQNEKWDGALVQWTVPFLTVQLSVDVGRCSSDCDVFCLDQASQANLGLANHANG